jgi:ABC-type sugar transport system ATPase subunit
MRGIRRRFGSVQALRGADFSCEKGEGSCYAGAQ